MKGLVQSFWTALLVVLVSCSIAIASNFQYKVKIQHDGGNLTPSQALEMLQQDQQHTFLIDVRTRPEYQDIGHAAGSYNIPLEFWTGKFSGKKYSKSFNENFGKDLLARFNPKTDTLLFICRSGKRSCIAAQEAIKAGWPADKVFNVLGGFEGDKEDNKASAFHGQRTNGGWRNEGLPWTYAMDKSLLYQHDVTE